jgi:hypothetical protein
MRYLKKYEIGKYLNELDKKSKEYKNYEGKYVIMEIKNAISLELGKFKKIVLNGYYANFETYDWIDDYKGWDVFPVSGVYLDEFTILKVFDDFKQAQIKYKEMQELRSNANKYNL